jgi:hypothetical protein
MSVWGQRWGQGLIEPDDLDPKMLVWGMRRQIDPAEIPAHGFVLRFDFRGIPKSNRSPRYWWLVLRPDDIEVCLKAPSREVDVVIAAELMTFTKVWLGYLGLLAALASGAISLHGTTRAVRVARRLLALPDQPMLKSFSFSGAAQPAAIAAELTFARVSQTAPAVNATADHNTLPAAQIGRRPAGRWAPWPISAAFGREPFTIAQDSLVISKARDRAPTGSSWACAAPQRAI